MQCVYAVHQGYFVSKSTIERVPSGVGCPQVCVLSSLYSARVSAIRLVGFASLRSLLL